MIFDSTFLFSDNQAITATANSENTIDLGVTRDIGKGVPIPLRIQVTEDFAGLTDLTVSVESGNNEPLPSAPVIATSPPIPVAELVAGAEFTIQYMPVGTFRYIRLKYTVGGTNATAGAVTAGVVAGHQHGY